MIGAYDGHRVDVGRIVADSTWHHRFDINLDGFDPAGDDYRDIVSYFQNVAAWLAPRHKQHGMRDGVLWLALHSNELFEHQLGKLSLPTLVPITIDALGRWAPQCLVASWLLDVFPVQVATRFVTADVAPTELPGLHEVVAAHTLAVLQDRVGASAAGRAGSDADLDEIVPAVLSAAAERSVADFDREASDRATIASRLATELDVCAGGSSGKPTKPAKPSTAPPAKQLGKRRPAQLAEA